MKKKEVFMFQECMRERSLWKQEDLGGHSARPDTHLREKDPLSCY